MSDAIFGMQTDRTPELLVALWLCVCAYVWWGELRAGILARRRPRP